MFTCLQCDNNFCAPGAFRNGLKVIDDSYQSLSAEEQERVCRDLCGDEQPVEETPEFVNAKLEELDRALESLSNSVKEAYNKAKILEDPTTEEYVSSRKFRLMFLRADRFDTHNAAYRLARYLKEKLDLFGEEVLARRIRTQDLSQRDMEALESGFFCITNETDAAGRLLCFVRRSFFFGQNVTSLLRGGFYLVQLALEDNEEAQKKGLVVIPFNAGTQHAQWTKQIRNYMPMFRHSCYGLPIRIAAVHYFFNDMKDTFLLNLIAVVYPQHLRSRLHRHYMHTHEECLYLLLALGINPNALPYTEDGIFRKEILCRYLACQIP